MKTVGWSERLRGATWMYVLAPPVAWIAQFETVYVLAPPSRRPVHVAAIRAVSLAALIVAAASTSGAYLEIARARQRARAADRRSNGNAWIAMAGVAIGAFFCLVIVAIAMITWIVSPED